MLGEAEVGPASAEQIRRHAHQKRELQHQINQQADTQAQGHRQRHIALRIAHLTGQINGGAKTQQTEQDSATTHSGQQAGIRVISRGRAHSNGEIAPVTAEGHQDHRHHQRHNQFPDRDRINPARQAGHTAQVDPAEQQHQGDGHCQTQAAEHLNTASIFGEPGHAAGEVVDHRQQLNGWHAEVGDPNAPATNEARKAAMAEQRDLRQGA